MKTKFSESIPSLLDPDELWRQVTAAIRNSKGHPFWPADLEESGAPTLQRGSKIYVTYKALVADIPVTYRLDTFDRSRRQLSYRATEDHPLKGGAMVEVSARKNGGSILRWQGAYEHSWYSPAGIFLRAYFLPRFLADLKKGLARHEASGNRKTA